MKPEKNKALLKYLKIFFVVLVLYLVCRNSDISQIETRLKELNYFYLISFLLISLPMIWASSMKWKLFIKDTSVSILSLMNMYTISYFINLFTPSTVGGDVVRSLSLGAKIKSQSSAFSATFFERLTGLIAMLILVLCSYLYSTLVNELLGSIGLIFILSLLIILSFFISELARNKLLDFFEVTFAKLGILKNKLSSIILKLKSISSDSKLNKQILFKAFIWALVFHSLAVLNVYLAAIAINCQNVFIRDLAFVVPLILLVLSIPLTPGGLGIQEGAFFAALTKIGASPDEAILIAALLRLKSLLLAVIGGVLVVLNKKTKNQI